MRSEFAKRRKNLKVSQLFPQPGSNKWQRIEELSKNAEVDLCAVCNKRIKDKRKQRYCSSHCRKAAYSVQKYFEWNAIRKKVLERDGYSCKKCGKYETTDEKNIPQGGLHVDHIKPVSKGGNEFDLDNLQVLCKSCNLSKGNSLESKKMEDFYEKG